MHSLQCFAILSTTCPLSCTLLSGLASSTFFSAIAAKLSGAMAPLLQARPAFPLAQGSGQRDSRESAGQAAGASGQVEYAESQSQSPMVAADQYRGGHQRNPSSI